MASFLSVAVHIDPAVKREALRLLESGECLTQIEVAKKMGVNKNTVLKWVRDTKETSASEWKKLSGQQRLALLGGTQAGVVEPISRDALGTEPRKALDDFALFRRRYFGRRSTPWQEEAAYQVIAFLETSEKEFVVDNCPPGSGKSTLFTHDIPAWLTCRNRSIRGMMGSASQPLASRYLRRLMASFEATSPLKCPDDERRLGVSFDAWNTLAEDYGPFKPSKATQWSASQLLVAQARDRMQGEKDPTWTAVGIESTYIGGRYDICIWDDVVDPRAVMSLNEVEKVQFDWDSVAEKRLEPGGVLILQGQRLAPADIYRYCLDKVVGDDVDMPHDGCCSALPGRKYHHIVYRAHDEGRCQGEHSVEAPYWPGGCLLDPRRLTWRELSTEMSNDEGRFLQVYQQEDASPSETLVNRLWVKGGVDPSTREFFTGCWDEERAINEVPPDLKAGALSIAATDPSGAKSWAHEWWCYEEGTDFRYLINCERRVMQASDFLDWDRRSNEYVGLAEAWWKISKSLNRPITHWIVEWNAAQRYLLQNNTARNWQRDRNVTFIAHDTHKNKTDATFGVQALLRGIWRNGKVRLPGAKDEVSRLASLRLVDEVTKWRGDGKGYHNDAVMCQWFFEHNLERMKRHKKAVQVSQEQRPSWLKESA